VAKRTHHRESIKCDGEIRWGTGDQQAGGSRAGKDWKGKVTSLKGSAYLGTAFKPAAGFNGGDKGLEMWGGGEEKKKGANAGHTEKKKKHVSPARRRNISACAMGCFEAALRLTGGVAVVGGAGI